MDTTRTTLTTKIQSAGRLNEITYTFKLLESDDHRVLTTLRILEMFETTPQAISKTKHAKTSIELKEKANKIFVSCKNDTRKLVEAWELYSRSIATAPSDSPELALSYANRSAILMKLRKYEECVQDIDRALRLEYPDHLRGKLLCRKIECSRVLNEKESLNETLDEARAWLERSNLSVEEKERVEGKLKQSSNTLPLCTKSEDIPTIICASEALTVTTSEEFGRHVIATRDIHPGEILVVEEPYSKILSLDEVYTHCSHCLRVHWAMVPCEFCVYAMYCSGECKDEAWMKYHEVECGVTGYLVDLGFKKDGLFSMRLAVVAVREAGCADELRGRLRDNANNKQYLSDSYVKLYNLVTSVEKRSVSDLFDRSLNAAFILYYLCTLTTLLGKKFSGDMKELYMDETVTFVGGLILRHMQIIPCNIHSYEEERQMEIVDIGAMALPFCSLINHSCDPNVSRCTARNCMIVFAVVPIEKGSQIYDNYGSHYAVMSRSERRSKLKQYYFDCNCEPCRHDWPLYKSLPTYNVLVKDKNVLQKVEKALEKLDTYVYQAKEDQIEDKPRMISELAKMIDTLTGLLPLPCSEVNNAVETLKRVVTLTHGNKFEIPKL